jgi:hypothetical protein
LMLFIGSLKAGFVTERSELGSCRAFRFQYPILFGYREGIDAIYWILEIARYMFLGANL